jgi:hypothetical protein
MLAFIFFAGAKKYFVCSTDISCLPCLVWMVVNKSIAITTANLLFSFILLMDEWNKMISCTAVRQWINAVRLNLVL